LGLLRQANCADTFTNVESGAVIFLWRTGRLFFARIIQMASGEGLLPQFKTVIAREAPFDEHSSDSAVANMK
jgi:hypothetical protein